ncbi:alpha/beta fold hydrolase [Amycolatopsis sp. FDAARGOS 1241]|uniref:alpha/beta fold hydrolase n=1 Tax=Amycolatopsis sp. FDAARGOS 1241 TaxID=2778070 RepID=UPI00194E93D8|nr:alpha/beta fold hydrolase [Amycolatopsis sp. FDAARGOS 1241]QRP50372.1 alpha/beta fold hydrolase [Amycolatopsis sp. FDAARGOS 1241]
MIDGFGTRTTGGTPALTYLDSGGAARAGVLLLHSLGTDHRLWTACAQALAAEHRVLVPDTRGHGGSAWAAPLSVGDWVSDVERVRADAGLNQVTLVGLSMGGVQAIGYAARHPERVTALVIADSFAELDPEPARVKASGLASRVGDMAALAEFYVSSTFTVDPLPDTAESVRSAIAGMRPAAYAASAETCFGARLDHVLAGITAPALVLWGERDAKTPRELSDRIAERIPKARFAVVPDAGHLSVLENPREFTRLTRGFLAEVGEGGGRSGQQA